METARAEWDYPEAVLVEIPCPECCGGDFGSETYYDAAGKEVLYDPAEIPQRRATMDRP
jgi:hypothetical protein